MANNNPQKQDTSSQFVFGKMNYILMSVGILLIVLGFALMTGAEANTPPGASEPDPNYWNPDIFSWRRIRLAPFLVISGFVTEVVAILYKPKK